MAPASAVDQYHVLYLIISLSLSLALSVLDIDLFHPKETSITSIKNSGEIRQTWPVDFAKARGQFDGIIPSQNQIPQKDII